MKSAFTILFIVSFGVSISSQHVADTTDDNDFAEFEDFDSDGEVTNDFEQSKSAGLVSRGPNKNKLSGSVASDDLNQINEDNIGVVEDDDGEFEHFQDEEEFEGFDVNDVRDTISDHKGEPTLTMAKVPLHFRTHWDSYWMEILMLAGLGAYFANFIIGKNKNSKIAHLWLNTHLSLLEENFAVVGDDGKGEFEATNLMKESESLFTLWCSGRTCCEGMLVELKLIKRQDLIALVSGLMRSTVDQVHMKAEISKDVMDTFVFCVASKKMATKLFKEMTDLSKYCSLVSKPEEKYKVPYGFSVLSEMPEASSAMLDSRVIAALQRYGSLIDYIHISDQYSGPIQQEEPNSLKQPEVKAMLLIGLNFPVNNDMEALRQLLTLVFYIMERLRRYRLSKEAKLKAEKNRYRVEEQFLKSTHAARAEAAAQRREEKRKQEKEKVMADDDPEKQRRWEKKEQKRQAKKKAPKMKQLSIKSL